MNGNSFPNGTIFRMHMYISSKVTHAKYAVAETRISGVKTDYCDTCIEKVFTTTANHVFSH